MHIKFNFFTCFDNKYSLFIKIMKILRMQCFTFDNFQKFKIVIIAIEYMNVEFILFTCFDNNYISCLLRL